MSCVRCAVASKGSTNTCNFPPDAAAISFIRATTASRPHPMPCAGSVHEESVWRVLHATSDSTSLRMPASSTSACEMAPFGPGTSVEIACDSAGSAGSSDRSLCGELNSADTRSARNRIEAQRSFARSGIVKSPGFKNSRRAASFELYIQPQFESSTGLARRVFQKRAGPHELFR